MAFVQPSWFIGLLTWVLYFSPVIVCIGLVILSFFKLIINIDNLDSKKDEKWLKILLVSVVLAFVFVFVCFGIGGYLWHETYEVPSVNSKVITVDNWQVKPGAVHSENGMMVIDNADQLMLITTGGEGFYNDENFLFQKFDTRDILNQLKPGGTYVIEYYGWREGYNSGFPNILSVKEVVDESNTTNVSLSDYFGTKLSVN